MPKKIAVLLFAVMILFAGCGKYQVDRDLTPARRAELMQKLDKFDEELSGVITAELRVSDLIQKGVIYRELGDYRKAEKNYKEALKLAPTYYLALHNLAVVYEEVGDKEKAIEQYAAMNHKNATLPERAEAIDRIVVLYLQLGQPEKAETVLNSFAADYASDNQAKNLILGLREDIARVKAEQAAQQK